MLHVAQVDHATAWVGQLSKVVSNITASRIAHEATWEQLWDRSFVQVSAPSSGDGAPPATPGDDDAKLITDHVNWDRFLNVIQGRNAFAPIKFNG